MTNPTCPQGIPNCPCTWPRQTTSAADAPGRKASVPPRSVEPVPTTRAPGRRLRVAK